METDPVCKMKVDPATAKWTSDHNGKKYYFCAPGCRYMFEKDPERFINSTEPAVKM
jgi:Cu+-exporting ATPase